MSPEDRLATLEQEVARLRSAFQEFGALIQEVGSEQNMTFAAVRALIESSANPLNLHPVLHRELDAVETMALFQAAHEGQLEGAQAARASFLRALDTAGKKNLDRP